MSENIEKKRKVDFLSQLFRWKKLILINMTIVIALSVGISFLFPVTFKAAAYVLPAPNSNSLGGLSSLISDNSMLSVGAKLLGVGGAGENETILGLLNSKTVLKKIIYEFNLYDYYEIDDKNIDKAIKAFSGNLYFDMNEFGFLEIAVENKDANFAAKISNEFVRVVDSVNMALKTTNARNNRRYIEERFNKNQDDLKFAEEKFKVFQKKYGAYSIPDQAKAAITAIAGLESELIEKETILQSLKNRINSTSSVYLNVENQIRAIKKQIKKLSDSNSGDENSVLPQIKNLPDLQIEYLRLYREMEIQNTILKFMYPLYEQAKMEEQKNLTTLLIVENATPPQLKYKPKKAFIVIIGFSFAFLIHLIFIARFKNIYDNENDLTEFEEKEYNIYNKLKKLYSI